MTDNELIKLGQEIVNYCKKFNIPLDYLLEILEDQKVTPMIMGKAMEYNAYLILDFILPKNVWSVQKLNLNAQPGTFDEDISITHRRSGVILKVESKSAIRNSFSDGKKTRILKEAHFKVKCHRSRSNIKLAQSSNDRYAVGTFDIIVTTPLNSIFQSKTIGENLEVIEKNNIREELYHYYSVDNAEDLIVACAKDWRFCIPETIAIDGFIPRTPYVILSNDSN
ncbi:hypothetical protein H8E88_15355 [candidate division KSB1 bacterium]|nr:hypothetical protein [candidate division KSB1 bacterium]